MSQGGRETRHEVRHGIQATMMQVRAVRKYGRGTRTVTTVNLVAAVFPQSYTEKSILEGSDVSVSSVRAPPPLKGRHFIWTCQLTNATDRDMLGLCHIFLTLGVS